MGSTKLGKPPSELGRFVEIVFVCSERLESQTLSVLPMASIVRPEKAEVSSSFLEIGFMSSRPRASSQFFSSRNLTRYHSP